MPRSGTPQELQQVPAHGCSPALAQVQRTAGSVRRTRPVPAPITCVRTDNPSRAHADSPARRPAASPGCVTAKSQGFSWLPGPGTRRGTTLPGSVGAVPRGQPACQGLLTACCGGKRLSVLGAADITPRWRVAPGATCDEAAVVLAPAVWAELGSSRGSPMGRQAVPRSPSTPCHGC